MAVVTNIKKMYVYNHTGEKNKNNCNLVLVAIYSRWNGNCKGPTLTTDNLYLKRVTVKAKLSYSFTHFCKTLKLCDIDLFQIIALHKKTSLQQEFLQLRLE